jgi:hypothetical protein
MRRKVVEGFRNDATKPFAKAPLRDSPTHARPSF